MGKEMQLNDDEYKIVMAYRYKEQLAAQQEALLRTVGLCAGRETITPEMVRRLTSEATAYDLLLTKCGFLPEFEASDAEEAEPEETADEVEEADAEEDNSGRANAKL